MYASRSVLLMQLPAKRVFSACDVIGSLYVLQLLIYSTHVLIKLTYGHFPFLIM